jgi:hypothetical protein
LFNIPEIIFASGELIISLAVLAISVTFYTGALMMAFATCLIIIF